VIRLLPLALLPGCLLLAPTPDRVQLATDPGPASWVDAGQLPCAVHALGIVCAEDEYNIDDPPPLGSFLATTHGSYGTGNVAIRSDGTLVGWNGFQRPPSGEYVSVDAGSGACALAVDGAPSCWDDADDDDFPDRVLDLDVESGCAVRTDGALQCPTYPYDEPPSGVFSRVAATWDVACAIRRNGELACWGSDDLRPPSGRYQTIDAGDEHFCALSTDGRAACWGDDDRDQTDAPDDTFVQVSAGDEASCGLTADGAVVCWGAHRRF
jgi:alpha-tubulin suppressor-like RCC1 family protein